MSLLLLLACNPLSVIVYDVCELQLQADVASPRAGAPVTFTGGPFSEAYDTVVSVDGTAVDVDGIERTNCTACDACRANAECTTCGDCIGCRADCASCEQTLSITLPTVASGRVPVAVSNRHGAGVVFLEIAGTSPNTGDTASPMPSGDTGSSTADTGSGTADTGSGTGTTADTATP